jgi:uncharacterized protein
LENKHSAIKQQALSKKKQHKKLLDQLKKKKSHEVDMLFQDAHEAVFEKTNCLTCANCCKTTGPLFTPKDITRISSHLKLSEQQFISKYLKIDEDHDYVLQKTPCSFLSHDNYCSIYEYRPKACSEYPHTDRSKQQQIFSLTLKNCEICPAVYDILEQINAKIK